MKKLVKILGIVMVVALLAGMLTVAGGVPAAAANAQFSTVTTPTVGAAGGNQFVATPAASTWQMKGAADGKTLLAINGVATTAFVVPAATATTAILAAGATSVTVTAGTGAGFPATGYISIAGDVVAYSAVVGDTFTTAATAAHPAAGAAVNLVDSAGAAANTAGSNMLYVASTLGFASASSLVVAGEAAAVTYTGKTGVAFTGIPAAAPGNMAVAHAVGAGAVSQNVSYKTTNGGTSWTTTSVGGGLATVGTIVSIAFSSNFATDNTVAVATAAAVYGSTNGGASFGALPALVGAAPALFAAGAITSVDVAPYYTGAGTAFLAGVNVGAGAGGAGLFVTGGLGGAWTNVGVVDDVYGVAFSPNHRTDGAMFFVTSDNVAHAPNGPFLFVESKLGTLGVNATFGKPQVALAAAEAVSKATFAFPADFDVYANGKLFVGVNTNGISADAYRVSLVVGSGSTIADLNATSATTQTNVNSVSFKGNLADGYLYVGKTGASVVRATGTSTSSVSFIPASKAPAGTSDTIVFASPVAADTNIFALTAGTGAALSISTDGGVSFNQSSLINITAAALTISDLDVVDANNMFIVVTDGASISMVMKTTNGGTNWAGTFAQGVVAGTPINNLYLSPAYATDSTVYAIHAATPSQVWKSANGGASFAPVVSPTTGTIGAFAPVDATNFFVGSGNNVYKAGSFSAQTTTIPSAVTAILYVNSTNLFVGTFGNSVYKSADNGVTFAKLATTADISVTTLLADTAFATSNILYAGTAAAGVYSYTIGTSLAWTQLSANPALVDNIAQNADGVLYVAGTNGIYRSIGPAYATWRLMSKDAALNGGFAGYPAAAFASRVAALATGSATVPNNTLYAVAAGNAVYTVQDTAVAAPAVVAPAANAVVSTTTNISWTPVSIPANAAYSIRYDLQVATDANFVNNVVNLTGWTGTPPVGTATAATNYPITLTAGQTYWWRVRTDTEAPLQSKWSATTQFSVKLSQNSGPLTLGSIAGSSTNTVSTKPVFQWTGVDGAASYNLQVADNPVFVNPLDNQTGLNTTVWQETKTLSPATTYFWRVQAVSATGVTSDWVNGTFVTAPAASTATTTAPTATAPAVQPTIVITTLPQPTVVVTQVPAPIVTITNAAAPAPETPSTIWAVIAIGAILVIAVIVLIARTRRV